MVLSRSDKNVIGEIKQKVKNFHTCPYCKENVEIGVEFDILRNIYKDKNFPYPHIQMHGKPLHALLCYVDQDMIVRSLSVVKSVEISRDSETFKQITKKWANPY